MPELFDAFGIEGPLGPTSNSERPERNATIPHDGAATHHRSLSEIMSQRKVPGRDAFPHHFVSGFCLVFVQANHRRPLRQLITPLGVIVMELLK